MGARLVGKFAYIKNMEHIINQLEYAGNKIAHQDVVFENGRVKEQDGCTKLKLSDEEIKSVSYIKLFYKDGGYKKLDYDDYTKLVSNKEEKITISKIEALDGENLDEFEMSSSMVENKEYHELKDLDVKKYLNYIAERPGAEKEDGHGLFGINGNITTKEAVELALEHPDSIFWTCIISMRGEDGKRTGFDNRAAWKRLVIAKAPEIAKSYNISLENLVVNAGYHCNTDNDHVHITFYSKDKREGFVKGGKEGMHKASKRVLSLFLNDIFKDDVKEIQNLMYRSRQSIKTELKNHMLSLSQNDITDEKLVNMFVSLSDKIAKHKGKYDYAYLNSSTKQSVNELLRYVLKSNDNLSVLFKQLMDSKLEYIHMYNQFPEDVKKRDGETKSDYNQRLQNVRKNIDDKIQEAEDKIFSPQKGQATLQNIIVHSISDYIKERASPLENQPATKEKNIFDNPIPPPPSDKPEILATMDDFRNLVTFDEMEIVDKLTDGPLGDDWIDFTTIREALAENHAVLREDELDTIEEMDDYYVAELPDELSEIQDDITADVKVFASETRIVEKLTEPPKKATATKGKKSAYKSNYIEQAYKQIKKSVKTYALKQHLAEVFDGDLQQNNKDWIKLYEHIKNPPKEDDENAINKYQSQSKELVLNIFNRVLHNNKDINLYISQVNTEFNKHSGDNNISLTLENRLESDIYSGDLYTQPNSLIFSFAEKLPQNYFKMILHSGKSKQLLKPIYKNITDSIYGKLSLEGDNDVKILISQINEISQKFEGCNYPERLEIMHECQQLTANLLQNIDNSELSEQINKLEKHLQKEIISSTPEELQTDIEKLKINFRNGSFSVPYNYIIFAMGENKNETYGKSVMSAMKNEVKDLNSEIYKNLYEVLSHRKGKRERSPVYRLLCEVNNASTKEECNKITTKMLEEFRQNPNFNKQFNKVKSNFCENLSKCCTIDNTENIFEQTILFGDFGSLKNTIEFMAQQSESIVKKINRQKAFRCVKLMCGTLAYDLYDEANHQMQRNLSQKNTLNRGINKFITKKQNQQQNNYLSY